MASDLTVQTIRGPASGANANKVLIPSGQTLTLEDKLSYSNMPTGSILQVVRIPPSLDQTSISSTGTWFGVSGSEAVITTKATNSIILYHFITTVETDTTNAGHYIYHRVVYSTNNWSSSTGIDNSTGTISTGHDTYAATVPCVISYMHYPNVLAGTTLYYRYQLWDNTATNGVVNQQGLNNSPNSGNLYQYGYAMEIAA
jgi:hypothetical protein